MQFQLPRLKIGQQVQAEVSEVFANGDALVSFSGDLVRITNQTTHRFQLGETLTLRVTALKPLAFQWMGRKRGLDVSI
ncbi:MAG: hypothetical protein AB7N80_12940 [Bdellovibrionales bacterium]